MSRRQGRFQSNPPSLRNSDVAEVAPRIRLHGDSHTVAIPIQGKHHAKIYDVQYLACNNRVWRMLAWIAQECAKGKARPDAYISALRALGLYFRQQNTPLNNIESLDQFFFLGFWRFLNSSRARTATQAKRYATVRALMLELRNRGYLRSDFYIPGTPHESPFRTTSHNNETATLSESQLMQVGLRAFEDCRSVMRDFEEACCLIDYQKRRGGVERVRATSSLSEVLEYLDRTYPGELPAATELDERQHRLYRALKNSRYQGLNDIKPLFYPTPKTIVPFVVLIAIYTAFNADVVRFLRISKIHRLDLGSTKLITFIGEKPRSAEPQYASFIATDDPENPATIVDFLLKWRSRLVETADPETKDRLFTFVAVSDTEKGAGREARRSLRGYDYRASNVWTHNLRIWRKKHRLPLFALPDIRRAVLDFGDAISGGDLVAVQRLANHISAQTTAAHYATEGGIQRAEERLGHIMSQRERWHKTGGKVDPRRKRATGDIGAATPGFTCLDPYDSPVLGETQGRLCRAYGACPACPLAGLDVSSPYAYQRGLQLRERIQQAQGEVTPQRWLAVWAHRLTKLDQWLEEFPEKVVGEAAAEPMPGPIPPVE